MEIFHSSQKNGLNFENFHFAENVSPRENVYLWVCQKCVTQGSLLYFKVFKYLATHLQPNWGERPMDFLSGLA